MSLSVITENRKGGAPQEKFNLGKCIIDLGNNSRLVADDFQGTGDDFKERSSTEIRIVIDGEEIFAGTQDQLYSKLIGKMPNEFFNQQIEFDREKISEYDNGTKLSACYDENNRCFIIDVADNSYFYENESQYKNDLKLLEKLFPNLEKQYSY